MGFLFSYAFQLHTYTHNFYTHLNFKYSYHIKRGKWVFKVETEKNIISFEMNSLCGGNQALKTFIYFLTRSILSV